LIGGQFWRFGRPCNGVGGHVTILWCGGVDSGIMPRPGSCICAAGHG
jgi:hypothetical protein